MIKKLTSGEVRRWVCEQEFYCIFISIGILKIKKIKAGRDEGGLNWGSQQMLENARILALI